MIGGLMWLSVAAAGVLFGLLVASCAAIINGRAVWAVALVLTFAGLGCAVRAGFVMERARWVD